MLTINRYWYVLIVEKGIREGMYHSINKYPKASNKYIKDYD